MLIALIVTIIIIAYLIWMPKLESALVGLFFSFWFLSFMIDAYITVRNKHLVMHYEKNIVMPILIQGFGTIPAVIMLFIIEVGLIAAIPFLFTHSLSLEASAVTALAFGIAHMLASASNRKFVKKVKK